MGDASGRDGDLRGAAVAARHVTRSQHLPGVMDVEPMRSVPVRLRAGHRSRTLAITGLPATPRLNRIVDRERPRRVAPGRRSRAVDDARPDPRRRAGRLLQVEVLEGRRPVRDVPVAALVDDSVGLQAYMRIDALRRDAARRRRRSPGAAVTLDPAQTGRFYRAVKMHAGRRRRGPARRHAPELPRHDGREHEHLQIFFNVMFAGDHRVRRRLQRRARLAVGARARAGEPARARVHARRDLVDPAGRAGDAHAAGAPGRRGHRLRAGRAHHDRLQQRGVSAVLRRVAGDRSRGRF